MGYESASLAADGFEKMLGRLSLSYPEESEKEGKAKYFADSVNVERLGNNPVVLDNSVLFNLYKGMLI